MASVDATSFNSVLKEYYTSEQIHNVVYEMNPWFAMIPKNTGVSGKFFVQPIQSGIPQGRSADFATAQLNKTTNRYEDYKVTTANDFGVLSITRKIMKESINDRGAFFQARVRETDGMLQNLARSVSIGMYRNGGGALGQVASGIGTITITLVDIEEITNFERDMVIKLSATDGTSGAVRAGSVTIVAVDRDAGTVTADQVWTTGIGAGADDDFLFQDGDFGLKLSGLGAWIPDAAPTVGDDFFGVDRSVDPTRLAGSRIDSSQGIPLVEAWQNAGARLGREGAAGDIGLCSHAKYRDLVQELGNKVMYEGFDVEATNVGFKGVTIVGQRGPVTIFADQNCPDERMYLLTKKTWSLISLGPVPDMVDDDGVSMLREVNSAGYEIRADSYCNMVCSDARANAVILL